MFDTRRVVNTPYTRWEGDDLHGRSKVLTPVWVRLDVVFVRRQTHHTRSSRPASTSSAKSPDAFMAGYAASKATGSESSTTRSPTPTAATSESTSSTNSCRATPSDPATTTGTRADAPDT